MNQNQKLSTFILEALASVGVEEICICAGARNAPLVLNLESSRNIQIYSFFEERDAAFFALGRIVATQKPVAVLMTSGTAVSETLSACVEATYQGLPLMIVSADRPRRYRGSGAPQAIEQVGIFSHYVEKTIDMENLEDSCDLQAWSMRKPIHINVCLEEPNKNDSYSGIDFSLKRTTKKPVEFFKAPAPKGEIQNPCVIVGPIPQAERARVVQELERLEAPIYAETLSGIRHEPSLQSLMLRGGDELVRKVFGKGHFDSVLRVGGVPTLRFWRDLETQFVQAPVINVSHVEYPGLSRACRNFWGYENLSAMRAQMDSDKEDAIYILDEKIYSELQKNLKTFPQSEPSLLWQIAGRAAFENLYLGNSLPIREWDLVGWSTKSISTHGHRGANGIDGQVSGFLGWANGKKALGVFGDLTSLYNLSALSVTPQLQAGTYQIVVVNNSGGQIFEPMFSSKKILNTHEISFENWAKLFHWKYQRIENSTELEASWPSESCVIEIRPQVQQTKDFWHSYRASLEKL